MNRTRFTDLLPPGGAVVQSDLAAGPAQAAWWEQGLRPDEAACVAQAVPKRQREFTAGRNCARRALEQLGWSPAPSILVGSRREPLFPPGVTGSITHTHDYCAAAVLPLSAQGVLALGIDAEVNEPLEEGVARLVLLPAERRAAGTGEPGGLCADKLVFSIKEAFYKAFFQVAGQYLDFLDACVDVAPAAGTFSLRVLRTDVPPYFQGRAFGGRFGHDAARVYSAVVLTAL